MIPETRAKLAFRIVLKKFTIWLCETDRADTALIADRLAWDFAWDSVSPAWDGNDEIENWQAAYVDAETERGTWPADRIEIVR